MTKAKPIPQLVSLGNSFDLLVKPMPITLPLSMIGRVISHYFLELRRETNYNQKQRNCGITVPQSLENCSKISNNKGKHTIEKTTFSK